MTLTPQESVTIIMWGAHPVANVERLRAKLRTPAKIVPHDGGHLGDALAQARVAVAMRWGADMPPMPNLAMLQLPGAGYDGIEFAALPADCRVCNVHEHEIGIGEYVLSAMLEWSIGLCRMDRAFKAGSWEHSLTRFGPTHGEIHGKTVAILGFGHIGRAVAHRAKAFGMRVIAITRAPLDDSAAADAVVPVERMGEALAEADFVVLACPLTPRTEGLIDRHRLAEMKRDAVLINVARARVVDEDDLFAALSEKVIGGAVLDVWYRYPPPGEDEARPSRHPFHKLDNVIMTPHASAWTDGLLERRWTVIADNIDRFAAGRPLRNIVARPDA